MSGETKTPVLRFPDALPWEEKRIGDSFNSGISNNTFSRAELSLSGEIRNIHYGDVLVKFGSVLDVSKEVVPFVADKSFKCTSKNQLADGDIVMADTAEDETVGKVTEILGADSAPTVSGLHTIVLRPLSKYAEGFLGYSLNAPAFHERLVNLMQGIKVLSINKGTLAETVFLTPTSPSEQQSIGGFFRELDALIAEREKALGKLESLKKAMLEKMFPQGDAKVPEVRFKGFEGEWEEKKLGDVCTGFDYGLNVAATKFDGRNRYIRITDIDDDSHAYNVLGAVSPDCNLSESKESIVCKGDILLARTGASVGKSYLYNENDGVMYFAGFLIRAHVSGEYDDFFVFCNTLTERYRQFVELTSQRSGQPGINAAEYKAFSFLTPVELAEQQAIGSFFHSLDALLAARREEAEKLKQLKKAFLERMFA